MKQILKFLENNAVNISVIIILFILTIFISHTIDKYTTFKLIETTFELPDNYKDFMTNYYQTQANWLMFWLTLLACLTGIIGIAIPFILNQSYREKIKEMECEFEKRIKDLDNYKKQSAENLQILKKDVKEIKKQAEQSKQVMPKLLSKELEIFKNDMQNAIQQVKQNSIQLELENLATLARNSNKQGNDDEEFHIHSRIIQFALKSKKQYKNDNIFQKDINFFLENSYYSRGLIYLYNKKSYNNAMNDFISSQNIIEYSRGYIDQTVQICILTCLIKLKKFKEGIPILEKMNDFTYKELESIINELSKEQSQDAVELLNKIKNKIEN